MLLAALGHSQFAAEHSAVDFVDADLNYLEAWFFIHPQVVRWRDKYILAQQHFCLAVLLLPVLAPSQLVLEHPVAAFAAVAVFFPLVKTYFTYHEYFCYGVQRILALQHFYLVEKLLPVAVPPLLQTGFERSVVLFVVATAVASLAWT